jgi:hypothetical protein
MTNLSGDYALPLGRIQQALGLRALSLYVEPPADLKPGANDTAETFLRRVVERGVGTKDWQLVYRALNAGQQAGITGTTSLDLVAYHPFLTALNQEKAGLWTAAVRSYLAALKVDAPNVPAEEIGRRLAQLKAAHPAEYETGEKTPEFAMTSPFPPSMMQGRFPPGYDPSMRGVTPAEASAAARAAALPVPPADAVATPPAKPPVPAAK